jgi:hypothetical protein
MATISEEIAKNMSNFTDKEHPSRISLPSSNESHAGNITYYSLTHVADEDTDTELDDHTSGRSSLSSNKFAHTTAKKRKIVPLTNSSEKNVVGFIEEMILFISKMNNSEPRKTLYYITNNISSGMAVAKLKKMDCVSPNERLPLMKIIAKNIIAAEVFCQMDDSVEAKEFLLSMAE